MQRLSRPPNYKRIKVRTLGLHKPFLIHFIVSSRYMLRLYGFEAGFFNPQVTLDPQSLNPYLEG